MEARLQLRVQRYGWDAAAAHYEAGWADRLAPAQARLIEMAALAPGQVVVETACGTGLVTRALARAVAPGRVLASDLSQAMIDDLAGKLDGVELARANAEDLPYEDGLADRAVSALGLMYVPDPGRAVAEMARVLKPGGLAAATVWGERRNCGWAEIFPIVDARVASEVCPMFFGTGVPTALMRHFEAAGLGEIAEQRQHETLEFSTGAELVKAMLDGGPVALAAKRFDDATRAEVAAEFLASVAEYRQDDGSYAIPGEFVTVTGTRR